VTFLAALLIGPGLAAAAAEPASSQGRTVVGGVVRSREWVIRRSPRREESSSVM